MTSIPCIVLTNPDNPSDIVKIPHRKDGDEPIPPVTNDFIGSWLFNVRRDVMAIHTFPTLSMSPSPAHAVTGLLAAFKDTVNVGLLLCNTYLDTVSVYRIPDVGSEMTAEHVHKAIENLQPTIAYPMNAPEGMMNAKDMPRVFDMADVSIVVSLLPGKLSTSPTAMQIAVRSCLPYSFLTAFAEEAVDRPDLTVGTYMASTLFDFHCKMVEAQNNAVFDVLAAACGLDPSITSSRCKILSQRFESIVSDNRFYIPGMNAPRPAYVYTMGVIGLKDSQTRSTAVFWSGPIDGCQVMEGKVISSGNTGSSLVYMPCECGYDSRLTQVEHKHLPLREYESHPRADSWHSFSIGRSWRLFSVYQSTKWVQTQIEQYYFASSKIVKMIPDGFLAKGNEVYLFKHEQQVKFLQDVAPNSRYRIPYNSHTMRGVWQFIEEFNQRHLGIDARGLVNATTFDLNGIPYVTIPATQYYAIITFLHERNVPIDTARPIDV